MLVSFIIPAHDEELLLPRTLRSIRAAGEALGEAYEVVVADDASSDRTPVIGAEFGARVVRIEARQIAGARNAGARASAGKYLIFVDADTMVTPDVVREAVAALRAGAAYGGSDVDWDGRIPLWSRGLLRATLFLYRRFGLASGAFLFCTREAFEAVGGFDERYYCGEEVLLARALRKQGRYAWVPSPVVTSGRKLRTYSFFEMLFEVGKLIAGGPRRAKRREKLGMWYGPRREDPLAVTESPEGTMTPPA